MCLQMYSLRWEKRSLPCFWPYSCKCNDHVVKTRCSPEAPPLNKLTYHLKLAKRRKFCWIYEKIQSQLNPAWRQRSQERLCEQQYLLLMEFSQEIHRWLKSFTEIGGAEHARVEGVMVSIVMKTAQPK